jgi:hypothetical protein
MSFKFQLERLASNSIRIPRSPKVTITQDDLDSVTMGRKKSLAISGDVSFDVKSIKKV